MLEKRLAHVNYLDKCMTITFLSIYNVQNWHFLLKLMLLFLVSLNLKTKS
jgi:hypothetical protein